MLVVKILIRMGFQLRTKSPDFLEHGWILFRRAAQKKSRRESRITRLTGSPQTWKSNRQCEKEPKRGRDIH